MKKIIVDVDGLSNEEKQRVNEALAKIKNVRMCAPTSSVNWDRVTTLLGPSLDSINVGFSYYKNENPTHSPQQVLEMAAPCTEEKKKKVQKAFFDAGILWGYHGKKYKFLNAVSDMKNKEWSGEGIPPIGTVCEYKSEGGEWRKCEVVAYHNSNVVAVDMFDSSAVCLHFGFNLFRPVRTPEQLAEEERLQVVDEMLSSVDRYSTLKDIMCALYNAGYRKQAK